MAIDKKAGAGANKKGKKGNKKMYVPLSPAWTLALWRRCVCRCAVRHIPSLPLLHFSLPWSDAFAIQALAHSPLSSLRSLV